MKYTEDAAAVKQIFSKFSVNFLCIYALFILLNQTFRLFRLTEFSLNFSSKAATPERARRNSPLTPQRARRNTPLTPQ